MNWQEWTGRIVKEDVRIGECLGGSEKNAIYATSYSGQKAVLKLAVADPETIGRELERLKTIEKLSHPHLLKVFCSGHWRVDGVDCVYAVVEFAEENLWQVIPQRALTAAEAKEVLLWSTDALKYLHEQGFVHGDLKPGNIMAAGDQLKLAVDGARKSGEPLGRTPETHDAPESVNGLTPASDSWSLGMTLVEMLTQEVPAVKPGESSGPVMPEVVPAPFREIAQHCLLKTPELRWSMNDIAVKLREGEKKPVVSLKPVSAAPSQKPAARKPAAQATRPSRVFAVVACAVVIVIVAIVVIPHFSRTSKAGEGGANQTPASTTMPQAVSQPTQDPLPVPKAKQQSAAVQVEPTPELKKASAIVATRERAEPTAPSDNSDEVDDTVRDVSAASHSSTPATSVSQATQVTPSQDLVVRKVLPQVPAKALSTIHGTVRVKLRVNVDGGGNVVGSQFVTPGPSKYFAKLAQQAAEEWKFSPAHDGSRTWDLRFDFRQTDVQAFPNSANGSNSSLMDGR